MTAEGNVARLFGELSEVLGLHRAVVPDEHDRWIVYQHAFDRREAHNALLAMVRLEPDHHVATGVVLEMIERVPQGDVAAWVDALPPGSSGERLARQRADACALSRHRACVLRPTMDDTSGPSRRGASGEPATPPA